MEQDRYDNSSGQTRYGSLRTSGDPQRVAEEQARKVPQRGQSDMIVANLLMLLQQGKATPADAAKVSRIYLEQKETISKLRQYRTNVRKSYRALQTAHERVLRLVKEQSSD